MLVVQPGRPVFLTCGQKVLRTVRPACLPDLRSESIGGRQTVLHPAHPGRAGGKRPEAPGSVRKRLNTDRTSSSVYRSAGNRPEPESNYRGR